MHMHLVRDTFPTTYLSFLQISSESSRFIKISTLWIMFWGEVNHRLYMLVKKVGSVSHIHDVWAPLLSEGLSTSSHTSVIIREQKKQKKSEWEHRKISKHIVVMCKQSQQTSDRWVVEQQYQPTSFGYAFVDEDEDEADDQTRKNHPK